MMTIMGKVEVVLHCEAKLVLLSFAVWALNGKGILFCLLLHYLHAGVGCFTGAYHEVGISKVPLQGFIVNPFHLYCCQCWH